LNTVFSIGSEDVKSDTLLLELGQDHCCYAYLDSHSKSFTLIRYVSLDEFESEEKLFQVLGGIGKNDFEKVVVCSAFAQALLVPQKYFSANLPLTTMMYDIIAHKELNDSIAEWQMVTSYSMPLSVYESILSRFNSVDFFHACTPSLKIYNGFVAADQVNIHFTTRFFRVIVKKNQQVQLAQTYSYRTPLDVAYYLLKICYEFRLEQSTVFLVLSGLIEQDSALYEELHNYFLNLHFAQAPTYTLPENQHPHYYFTSLYNLAACVS
jgi:hypothetical protein